MGYLVLVLEYRCRYLVLVLVLVASETATEVLVFDTELLVLACPVLGTSLVNT